MIEYLTLLAAIPLGMMLSQATKKERGIYRCKFYLPLITVVLAILALIFLFRDKVIGMTLAFMFIMTLTWWRV